MYLTKSLIFIIIVASVSVAGATYVNNSEFGLGNGVFILINDTTIDDLEQLQCCDNSTLHIRQNQSQINLTASANKTITAMTLINITDIFTLPLSGTAGYINFSVTMKNASVSYNLSDGAFVESRNTTADKNVWFNYTLAGTKTLTVSWNQSSGIVPEITYAPNITAWANNINGWNQTAMSINVANSATFNVTVNQTVSNVSWKVEGIQEQNTSALTFTRAFNSVGSFNVTVQAFNENGSSNIIYTVVTVVTGGGGGTDWDYAYGYVSYPNGTMISGATVTTIKGTANTNGAGYFSFGYVFEHGLSYDFNITKSGHTWNNSTVSFAGGDYQIINRTIDLLPVLYAPSIIDWSNNNTSNAALTLTVDKNTSVIFNVTANQTITGCSWIGATQINCSGLTTYAEKTFISAGVQTVSIQVSNANGSTQIITWTITVSGSTGLKLSGYVSNTLELALPDARIDVNNTHTFTNTAGYYEVTGMNEGTYTVTARQIAYKNATNTTTISTNTTINFTLREKTAGTVTTSGFEGLGMIFILLTLIYLNKKRNL